MRSILLVLLAMTIVPAGAASQDCLDYGEYIHWQSGMGTGLGGGVTGVAVSDKYLYFVSAYREEFDAGGFQVFDITDPTRPKDMGALFSPWDPNAVTVSGNYAYVTDGNLRVVDVTNPSGPRSTGGIVHTPGYANGVTVSGGYAYVADGQGGLQVIDITEPAAPQLVGGADTPGYAAGVTVSGSYAYVADGGSGLQVIDITDPAAPQLVGAVDTPGYAANVAVFESYVCVADAESGLQVIDVTNPAVPRIVGGVVTAGNVSDVSVSGDFAYVAGGNPALQVIDITDPENPRHVSGMAGYSDGRCVAVSDGNAYLGVGTGIQVIDITNLATPPGPVADLVTPGFTHDAAISGDCVYLAAGEDGLQVVDITDPTSPRILDGLDMPGTATGVTVSGSYAYIANGDGLQVVDVTDPASLRIVGSVATPEFAQGVATYQNYAYVASGRAGLHIVDVTDPANPWIVGSVRNEDYVPSTRSVTVSGSYAYVTDRMSLLVMDITDPADPQIVGELPGVGPRDVAVSGGYAYVGGGSFRVVDITDPTNPRLLDTPNRWPAFGVTVSGDYAYIAGGHFRVVDIADSANPRLVGGMSTPGNAQDVVVVGEYAIVADGASGLQVLRLQCNDSTLEVSIDIKPGNAQNPINCKGNPGLIPVAVLTTDTFDALSVDHTTVRFGPGEAAEFHVFKGPESRGNGASPSRPISGVAKRHEKDVDHDGDVDLLLHFARDEAGIRCGDTEAVLTGQTYDGQSFVGTDAIRTVPDGDTEPEPEGQLQISPNPFNPSTSISFVIGERQHVRVGVYDVRGRLVAELANDPYPAGRHVLEWRGRDAAGRTAPSGTYFFRVDLEGRAEVAKALLMK